MYFYESKEMDPYFNLALEEYLFNHKKIGDSIFMLWQNLNTVVLGKNQNVAEEINREYVDAHDVKIARRLSGGGAVYHDSGNLNYTIITEQNGTFDFGFDIFSRPLINVLKHLGINAQFSGRNDITIDGKKVSGSSEYIRDGKLLHHGCIMLDTDLEVVSSVLQPPEGKLSSKNIKSVRSRITSINQCAPYTIEMENFKNLLKQEISKTEHLQYIFLSDKALKEIYELQKKYASTDWIYGKTLSYNLYRTKKFPTGLVGVNLDVKDAYILSIYFFGDFFGNRDVCELEEKLTGIHIFTGLETCLDKVNVEDYIYGISKTDLISLLR